jgi:hypothetical protein
VGWQGRLIEIDRAELLTAHFEVDINAADWPDNVCICAHIEEQPLNW